MQEHGTVTSIISITVNSHPSLSATWRLHCVQALQLIWAAVVMVSLTFHVDHVECRDTRPGQAIYVVGSAPQLGEWQVWQGAVFLGSTTKTEPHCHVLLHTDSQG